MQIAGLLEVGIPLVACQADLTPAQRIMLLSAFQERERQYEKDRPAKKEASAGKDVMAELRARRGK